MTTVTNNLQSNTDSIEPNSGSFKVTNKSTISTSTNIDAIAAKDENTNKNTSTAAVDAKEPYELTEKNLALVNKENTKHTQYEFSSESSVLSDLADSEAETEKMNPGTPQKSRYPVDENGELKSHLFELSKETEVKEETSKGSPTVPVATNDEDAPADEKKRPVDLEDDNLDTHEVKKQKLDDTPEEELSTNKEAEQVHEENEQDTSAEAPNNTVTDDIEVKTETLEKAEEREKEQESIDFDAHESHEVAHEADHEDEDEDDQEDEDEDDQEEEEEQAAAAEDKEKIMQKKQEEEAQRQLLRKEAVAQLTEIEIEFAKLKDKLYLDKLKAFESEIQMCINGSHPALKSVYQKIEEYRNKKLTLIQNKQKYQLLCIDRQTRAERVAIHQQFLKDKSEIKLELLDSTTVQWYNINRDRRMMNNVTPEYSFRALNSAHDQSLYLHQVERENEILANVKQNYGFPVAPRVSSCTKEENEEDFGALGIV